MNRILRITAPAQQDLQDIWLSLEPFGVAIADRRLAELQRKLLQLQQFPGMGRSREDLAPGLRSTVVGEIVIIYRALEGLLVIVRVVQGRRDLKRLWDEPMEESL
ncbi:MAG: type II toxin-antitoxin system RelE/ParE family toxin [Synechococcales cyanobacterium RU_4_20]|nr:type II toxin-antitoxin system RelE/ParE family toxin [Synechococcales cyanobacterium RU_4_20]NJR70619.1 type II toxin-antitoxin system RelE/ParE family toxin [Synechococcales cyanobacterium CRU_2_2]